MTIYRTTLRIFAFIIVCIFISSSLLAQNKQVTPAAPTSGKRAQRLVIRNAMVIDGNGTPASGPKDIVVEGNTITEVVSFDPIAVGQGTAKRPAAGDVEIDATGKYVLPGLINAHGHIQDERGGVPQPVEYCWKMWLACGITTVREVGGNIKKSLQWREQSNKGEIVAPRFFIYGVYNYAPTPRNVDEARARVREIKTSGLDGIKFFAIDRDLMAAMLDEAHKQGLRTAHHAAVAETNAWDDVKFGTTSIEHWYGIPDAAIDSGRQNFPPTYNYDNEVDRFRYAGHLWREASPERLTKLLDAMIAANVAWDPTLDIYEASRDLQRAQSNPAFADYLHPTLEEYFRPNPKNHGS